MTGSNKGIGAEVCRQLGAQGLTPVVTGRNEAAAKKTAAAIAADVGREVPCHQVRSGDGQFIATSIPSLLSLPFPSHPISLCFRIYPPPVVSSDCSWM